MKTVKHKTHVFYTKKDYESFESRNCNNIYQSICLGKKCYKVKAYKSVSDHFSTPYQLHITHNDIPTLSKLFHSKYNCQ